MCGIIHIKRFDGIPVRKMIQKAYRKQEYRGKEGFGFISLEDRNITDFRKSETHGPILQELKKNSCPEILFHHRNPTSTDNFWESAHPIEVNHKDMKHKYFVAHNGSINDQDNKKFKKEHEELGFVYKTKVVSFWETISGARYPSEEMWNDSETFAIELARDLERADRKGLRSMWGKIAFVCIQVDAVTNKATKLFWGRNSGSPLKCLSNSRILSIISEGSGEIVEENVLFEFDYETGKITSSKYDVGYHYEYKYDSKYDSHGYKKEYNKPKQSTLLLTGDSEEPSLEVIEEVIKLEERIQEIAEILKTGGLGEQIRSHLLSESAQKSMRLTSIYQKYPSYGISSPQC